MAIAVGGGRSRLVWGAVFAVGALVGSALPSWAGPAGITVTNVGCGSNAGADLVTAIRTVAGASADSPAVLSLYSGCRYVLDTVQTDTASPFDDTKYGNSGTPLILGKLGIRGNGATISRSNKPGTPNFRIFTVGPGGQLAIDSVSISNGRATCDAPTATGTSWCTTSSPVDEQAFGGGIGVVNGSLVVTDSTFTGNTATCDSATSDCTATLGLTPAGPAGGAIGAQPKTTESAPASYVTITGSTFTGNSARCATSTNCAGTDGGAVGTSGSDLHVTGSHFQDNSSTCTAGACVNTFGGALFADVAPDAVTVAASDFGGYGHPNTAGSAHEKGAGGGAIALFDSTAALTGNQIQYNQANATASAQGGGVFLDSVETPPPTTGTSVTDITGGAVSHNTATASTSGSALGGGITAGNDNSATGDRLHLAHTAVTANTATGGIGGGGGLISSQPVYAADTHFDGNTLNATGTTGVGGGLLVQAPLSLTGGSVSRNRVIATATGSLAAGGGIDAQPASATDQAPVSLVGVQISGNSVKGTTTVGGGGIIAVDVAPMIVQNSQVEDNTATATDPSAGGAAGGGVYTSGGAAGFVGGTRITGNTATGKTQAGGGIYNAGGGQDEVDPTSSVHFNHPDQCNADTTADAVAGC